MLQPDKETITVTDGAAGDRIDRLLAATLPDMSRSRLKALIEQGRVTADGRTIMDASYRVKPGETLTVAPDAPVDPVPQEQAIPLHILHEDAHLIVLDKPAGMVVHPAAGNADGTLVNALIAHCGDSLSGIGGVRRPGIVHRLDKDTSGVMVAAKTDTAHRGLAALFEAHDIDRAYLAVVRGRPATSRGTIEARMGRDARDRKRMKVLEHGGRHAVTHYRLVEAFGEATSLLRCTLETGRTHQIRVHLSHLGHPVIGDPTYGRMRRKRLAQMTDVAADAVAGFPRQALHATRLGFAHPVTGEDLTFEAPPPSDMEALIQTLRANVE
ncbi:MAG: pseudouridine synthase [Minwuia thermotolerans]|nr:MAG: pseudouridine synthase [Minwuia thermotolerans]